MYPEQLQYILDLIRVFKTSNQIEREGEGNRQMEESAMQLTVLYMEITLNLNLKYNTVIVYRVRAVR